MITRSWLLAALLLIPLAGQAQEKVKVKRDRNRITHEEIEMIIRVGKKFVSHPAVGSTKVGCSL